MVGATPVFVVVEPDSYNIDPVVAEAAITSRTSSYNHGVYIDISNHPLLNHLMGHCVTNRSEFSNKDWYVYS